MTAERNIVRDQHAAMVAVSGETGRAFWPPQPAAPDLGEGPEQVYREVPADAEYWSNAARAVAEGWQVPLPALDENIRQREALRLACRRIDARRLRDPSYISRAVRQAADLLTEDPAAVIVEAIEGVALDAFCQSIGSNDSVINALSWQLETNWRQLCFDHQRAILRSLIGRDSPAANNVRHYVESLGGLLKPPGMGAPDWVIRLA
jgi:hypothetical protein